MCVLPNMVEVKFISTSFSARINRSIARARIKHDRSCLKWNWRKEKTKSKTKFRYCSASSQPIRTVIPYGFFFCLFHFSFIFGGNRDKTVEPEERLRRRMGHNEMRSIANFALNCFFVFVCVCSFDRPRRSRFRVVFHIFFFAFILFFSAHCSHIVRVLSSFYLPCNPDIHRIYSSHFRCSILVASRMASEKSSSD